MNLSGKWSFSEDFSFGKDEGVAELFHVNDEIKGKLTFAESIEGEDVFSICCEIEGKIDNNQIIFNTTSFEVLESSEPITYYPEVREGIINMHGQIVGSSEDTQGVCGVFIMKKIEG